MLNRLLVPLVAAAALLFSNAVWADTFVVPSAQFPTVQSAVSALAASGDVIELAPGTYVESVLAVGKSFTLQSQFATTGDPADIAATVIEAPPPVLDDGGTPGDPSDDELVLLNVLELKALTTNVATPPVVVKLIGLTFQGGESGVLVRPNVTAELSDVHILGTQDGFELEGRGTPTHGFARGIAKRSVFAENEDDGIDVDQRAELWVEDSIIQDNEDDGIEIRLQNSATGSAFAAGEHAAHRILRNEILRNGEDGIQLIDGLVTDEQQLTPRSFRIERNRIADNLQAGLGLMCNQVSVENYEGCAMLERVELVHNTFARNDHGATGGANLLGVNNLFVGHVKAVKRVLAPDSLLAQTGFHGNALDVEESNVTPALALGDPLLDVDDGLGDGSPAVDAGVTSLGVGDETILDLGPCDYRGEAPDLGFFERDTGPVMIETPGMLLAGVSEEAHQRGAKLRRAGKSLELGSSKGDAMGAFRFEDVQVPAGAEITAAQLEVVSAKKATKPAALLVHGEASGDSASFLQQALLSRKPTAANVAWPVATWADAGVASVAPDLASVVQEIVNQPDWSAGNALTLLVTGTGKRPIAAFAGQGRALLQIDYLASEEACVE